MIQLPTKPWNEGDTFTNDTTGVEYTFDGVKWLASGAEDDGASQEEKVALIEAQIQYRGLLTLDADGKPVWPADQTKDRGGWWAYPTSTTGSGWNYNALQWIFPKDGDVNDVAKATAPKYEVGDIIQLQVSENEAGSGTSWQYFDTATVFVEYMVEEVYYPDTLSGNSNNYHPAYRVSMSGPAHRYTGRLPKTPAGLEGDPSDAWIQWYPTVFAYGATVPEDAPEKVPTALGTLRWNDYSWDSGNIDSLGGVARFHPDRTKMCLNHDTSDMGRVDWGQAFGDYPAEIGIEVEGHTYRAVVNFTGTAGTNSRGKNFEIVESNLPDSVTYNADVTFYDCYVEQPINIDDYATIEYVDGGYLKLSGGEMATSAQLAVNYIKPINLKHIQYECDPTADHPEALVNRNMVLALIEEASGRKAEIPEWTLAHYDDSGEMPAGKMAFFDLDFNGTNRLEDVRGICFSAIDANGNRLGRSKDSVEWRRDFGGALTVLYDEEKTMLSMARSHSNAAAIIYYSPDFDAYTIMWLADKDAVVTSNVTHVNVDQSYKIHCPEIFF